MSATVALRNQLAKFFLWNAATKHGVPVEMLKDDEPPPAQKIDVVHHNAPAEATAQQPTATAQPEADAKPDGKVITALKRWWPLAAAAGLGAGGAYVLTSGGSDGRSGEAPPAAVAPAEGPDFLLEYLQDKGYHTDPGGWK